MRRVLLLFLALGGFLGAAPKPPGVVLNHSPAASKRFIGSPTLCVLPNGDYLAAHDLFGRGISKKEGPVGSLFRSTDQGRSWKHERDFEDYFWSSLFVHRGHVYLLGTSGVYGQLVIRRSTDMGKSWTGPVVLREGQWHTAPVPIIEHEGRLWRAVEDAHTSGIWGERFRALMMSAPVGADLLDPATWTYSNALARDPRWLEGKFEAWLEGNAVVSPEGEVVNILRVEKRRVPEKAALVKVSKDGTLARFDAATGFIDFPGAAKKFVIRKDPSGPGYWALTNFIPERHREGNQPGGIRNTLALAYSADLRSWEIRTILLYHPDVARHGFQYPDWHFEGADLIAVSRTAFADGEGGAHSAHDSNFITFHRWKNFRKLTRADDVPMPEMGLESAHRVGSLSLKGTYFEIAPLENGQNTFANRGYPLLGVPADLAGRAFTRLDGGAKGRTVVSAEADGILTIATAKNMPEKELAGWEATGRRIFYITWEMNPLLLYTRAVKAGEKLVLPRGNWSGSLLILPKE